MKILVLSETYPDLKPSFGMMYVHVRCREYQKSGIDVTVLNFRAAEDYTIDGVKVVAAASCVPKEGEYDCLISHAPNLRHHLRFLDKYGTLFPHFIFFFHGHEVMDIGKTYPKPYSYMKKNSFLHVLYDPYKLSVMRRTLVRYAEKSDFIFVSSWLRQTAFHFLKIESKDLLNHDRVISNSVGPDFCRQSYSADTEKTYDFITVRSIIDGSTYCVDFVNRLAAANPDLKFLLIGRGKYFDYADRAANLEFRNQTMTHGEIISCLNRSRCALMPTRHDTQGVMSCETATFGMPLITSDIPVTREVFASFPNVGFIKNEDDSADLHGILAQLEKGIPYPKNKTYFPENTIGPEIQMLQNLQKNS